MKSCITLIILIVCFFTVVNCTSQKKVVYYTIPPEYTGQTRENLVKMLDFGQKMFRINCSPCHGIFTNGKDSIPNFSKTQIEVYKKSALMDDAKNHAVILKVRPEDLDMILQFLAFRKVHGDK